MKKIIAIGMVIAVMLTLVVSVAADTLNPSPTKPGTEYKIVVQASDGGTAIYRINEDGSVTFIANPTPGHQFTKWIIEGDYVVVTGTVTDKEFTVTPKSDLKAFASFDGKTEPGVKPWPENDSPKTGNFIAPVVIVAVVSLIGCAWCAKKSVKD